MLHGEVQVPGAKNSVLKLMAATLLAEGEFRLTNVPDIADVSTMCELLEALGMSTQRLDAHELLLINSGNITPIAPFELVDRIRASINLLGPLLGKYGHVDIAMPGGDDFGSRPIDLHVAGLEAMGAIFDLTRDGVKATAAHLHGAQITLKFPSVGATENIMTAAVLAKGKTILDNAAREPDIVDLGNFLISMGADITGLGTPKIEIIGVKTLTPTDHTTLPDRVVTGTWAFAAAITQGDITIHNCRPSDLEVPLDKLVLAGAVITTTKDGIRVKMDRRPKAIDVATLPYPGFPTDLQPMIIALNSIADGDAIVT